MYYETRGNLCTRQASSVKSLHVKVFIIRLKHCIQNGTCFTYTLPVTKIINVCTVRKNIVVSSNKELYSKLFGSKNFCKRISYVLLETVDIKPAVSDC